MGILLVNKEEKTTSFHLVSLLRNLTKIQKIGHAGTLDPFATGVMILLVGKEYTQKSNQFLNLDKQYRATLTLGIATDTFDKEGKVSATSDLIPSLKQVEEAIAQFQGTLLQTPPMFSAKKIKGQKLYDLARKGITIERKAVPVTIQTTFLNYHYPYLEIEVTCSKGTYIRSIASDLGSLLGSLAHLSSLTRLRSGSFHLDQCIPQSHLKNPLFNPIPHMIYV